MSAGFPYLQKLRKSELSEFAETTNLPDYGALKKADLEIALDEHLRANQTTFSKDKSLSEYYKRLSTSRSPVKKMAEKITETIKSEDEPVLKRSRRKAKSPEDETTDTDIPVTTLIKAPTRDVARRASAFASSIALPPSPAVVTDAIDRQTTRIRHSISELYTETHIEEYRDFTRDLLSSPVAISAIAILLEAYGLRKTILPNKAIGDIPPILLFKDTKTTIYVPDLFLLLEQSFWAPFSLWLLTSLVLPLVLSYFINLSHKAAPGHGYVTRRAASIRSSPELQFDPFIYNIAKALITYLVYAQHFPLFGLYQHFTIATVNESVLGGWLAMVTSAGIGVLISLYEAVLKK